MNLLRTVLVLSLAAAAACAPAPRMKPIKGDDVAEGTGTLTAARKYLLGRWNLESFEVFPPGRPPVTAKGQGTLNYDDFGNMRIEIRTDEKTADGLRSAGIEIVNGTISSNGRTVIDIQRKTVTYILEGQATGAAPTGPLALNRPRYWEVTGDTLTLTTKDDAGKPLSVGHWRRMP